MNLGVLVAIECVKCWLKLSEKSVRIHPTSACCVCVRFICVPVCASDSSVCLCVQIGVVLSGGQAPGGHNVIAGLFDMVPAHHCCLADCPTMHALLSTQLCVCWYKSPLCELDGQ